MDRLEILGVLTKTNAWHKSGEVPKNQVELFKRREFYTVERRLNNVDMAELVIGARRVGKSVMMYQLIQSLIEKKVRPERILFIQGDNPILREIKTEKSTLSEIFDIYQKYVLKEEFSASSDRVYVFIDEAQNLADWQLEIKTQIDLKYNVKFFVTGSSSTELRRGSQSPLVGRINIEVLPPFTFLDYIRFRHNQIQASEISQDLLDTSNAFRKAFVSGDQEEIFQCCKTIQEQASKYQIRAMLNRYLVEGGFPHTLNNRKEHRNRYLRDLLAMTLSKDILIRTNIREPLAFERLMVNICLSVGNRVSFKALAEKIGVDERSIVKYVDYYSESHWISVSTPYSFTDRQRTVRNENKVYVLDTGVINVLNFKESKDEILEDRQYRGRLIENVLYNHLLLLRYPISGTFQNQLSFWIEKEKGWEIDYIFEASKGVIPIECKAKSTNDHVDLRPIEYFLKKKTSSVFGVITTEKTLSAEGRIVCVPYWLLLALI